MERKLEGHSTSQSVFPSGIGFLVTVVTAVEEQMQQELGYGCGGHPPPLTSSAGWQDTGGRHRVHEDGQEAAATGAPTTGRQWKQDPQLFILK